jgi:prenyltransferase beta subunit
MTWQMASFAVLAIALAAGFSWYERAHPSAKVLALVATLAALAALGRLAFAPLPNVKPTTDIVLLSGYVLGGAPGFMVGAIAALASNFFFGQGPYTPWQMVGWGSVGLLGAALAATAGRDLGRWSLALACGAAGLGYGLFMDLHLWVMYTGHSIGELGVLTARSVPFNVAHVAGNVVFCLAFGPMLVRSLQRFRSRFEVTWRPAPATGAAAVALVAVVVAGLLAAPPRAQAADRTTDRAVAYLKQAQQRDGGFADARGGRRSNPAVSGWAVMGIAAAGRDPGRAARRYLRREAGRVRDVGDMERTILALRAAGEPAGDLARRLERRRGRDGSFEGLVNRSAFAVLALRAAGRPVPRPTVAWLERQQNRDGGWSVGGRGGPSGVDDTAAVVQALVAAGRRDGEAVRRAAAWLAGRQGADGGFPLTPGDPSNAQSTAFVVQALKAAGRDVRRVRRDGSRDPVAYLRTLQNPDGSIRYSRTSRQTPAWVTAQAVPALRQRPLPVTRKRNAVASMAVLVLGALFG